MTKHRSKSLLLRSSGARICVATSLCFIAINMIGFRASAQDQRHGESDNLDFLINQASEYCRKLEGVIFHFVCLEEIKEIIDPTLDVLDPIDTIEDWRMVPPGHPRSAQIVPLRRLRNSYIHDYQCIREGRSIRETRTLIEENGQKKNVPNTALQTSVVVYGNALLSPVNLFGERVYGSRDYRISNRTLIRGRPVVIIETKPKEGTELKGASYGAAWIDERTGEILKISWDQRAIGNADIFEKRGRRYGRHPHLSVVTEFTVEKNGIRFPSRIFFEEAYANDQGRTLVRSTTTVTYRDFKFFTVQVEIR